MLRRSHSTVQQFGIELHGNSGRNDDIVLLTGAPVEAGASHLFGQLVLNTLDATTVRKISIKLIGTMHLRWPDQPQPKGAALPVRYEKQLYSQEITDFDIPGKAVVNAKPPPKPTGGSLTSLTSYFKHGKSNENLASLMPMSQPGSPSHSPGTSPSNGRSPIVSRTASSVNFQDLLNSPGSPPRPESRTDARADGARKDTMHQLPPGNYRFPFEVYIPGELTESVEGNRYAQLSYWLVATVDRGFMKQQLTAKKHVRIVRTVGVDSYYVAHTVSIENTWPRKIEYKISIPSRAAAFGSQLELLFAMVPLDKGLRLGRIRAEIVEYVTIATPIATREEENVVARQMFEVPENFDHMSDEWELQQLMDVPRSLSRATQDATIEHYVKINHKFRCFIALINRDGHTSELRASLPITLYISPNIYVTSQEDEEPKPSKHSGSTLSLASLPKHHHHHRPADAPMFNVSPPPLGRSPSSLSIVQDNSAPPTYSHHVYDRLYSTVATPAESPSQSGAATPARVGADSNNGMDANQQAQLANRLRAIALSRQNSYLTPHLSRTSSYQRQSQSPVQLSRAGSAVDVAALSRVPSYDEAINEQAAPDAVPEYTS